MVSGSSWFHVLRPAGYVIRRVDRLQTTPDDISGSELQKIVNGCKLVSFFMQGAQHPWNTQNDTFQLILDAPKLLPFF